MAVSGKSPGWIQFRFRMISVGTAFGWGATVSSNLNFTEKDIGKFQLVYTFYDSISPINGVPLPVLGIVAFLDHTWSNRFTSSIGFSMVSITNSDAQLASDFHHGYYALTNLLYNPLKRVTIGGELQFGRRVYALDGYSVNYFRTQFSFKYDWNKGFEF